MSFEKFKEKKSYVGKALEVYDELVKAGELKSVTGIPKAGTELDSAIQNAWERVTEELKETGYELTEESEKKFRAKLDDMWGLANVGPDY